MASMETENKDTGRPVIDDVDPLLSTSSSSSSSRAPRRAPRSSRHRTSSSSSPIAIDIDVDPSSSSISIDADRHPSSSSSALSAEDGGAAAAAASTSSPTHEEDVDGGVGGHRRFGFRTAWVACAACVTGCRRGCAEFLVTNAADTGPMLGAVLLCGVLLLTPAFKVAIIMMTFLIFFISLRFCMLHVLPHMVAAREEVDGGDGTEEGSNDRSRRRRVRFRLGDLRRGRRRRRHGDGVDLDEWGMSRTHLRLSLRDGDFDANDYETLLRLDEEHNRLNFTGISQSAIERFPSYVVKSDVVKQCAICLEKPQIGDKIRTVPCLHAFHAKCIDKWLRSKPTCPVCTFDVRIS